MTTKEIVTVTLTSLLIGLIVAFALYYIAWYVDGGPAGDAFCKRMLESESKPEYSTSLQSCTIEVEGGVRLAIVIHLNAEK